MSSPNSCPFSFYDSSRSSSLSQKMEKVKIMTVDFRKTSHGLSFYVYLSVLEMYEEKFYLGEISFR